MRYRTKSIWTPLQDTPYSSYGMPQNITSAKRRSDPERSLRKRSAKWLGGYNTSHQLTHLTISSYSTWAYHNAIKPPPRTQLTRRALEEWERTICENKAIAILDKLQEGRPALFQKDGGAMLIAIVLDRPLQEAQNLVDQQHQFLQEIKQVLDDKKSHPILERMLRTIQGDVAKQEATSSKERPYYTDDMDDNQSQ